MQSAIEVADNGFRINKFLAANIADSAITALQPETAAIFRPGGVPLKEGDLLVQKDLATTFRLIAQRVPMSSTVVKSPRRSSLPLSVAVPRSTRRALA